VIPVGLPIQSVERYCAHRLVGRARGAHDRHGVIVVVEAHQGHLDLSREIARVELHHQRSHVWVEVRMVLESKQCCVDDL